MLGITAIKAWLDLFSAEHTRANLILLGGEPTLHPDLAAAVRHADRSGYQSITVDTNGYLFHDILHKVTPQEVSFLSFSLDGATRETNDALRGRGSYDVCLAGIRQAVAAGFNTSLIYTVSTANLHELNSMPALVADLGIKKFFIQVIGLRGKSAPSAETQPGKVIAQATKEDWLDRIPGIAREIAELGITAIYPKVFLGPEAAFECAGIVAENYFIFPNGRVYRCPLCEDFPLHSKIIRGNKLIDTPKINETDLFALDIPEGCVMNRLLQPANLRYAENGRPLYRIACCLLKEEIRPRSFS